MSGRPHVQHAQRRRPPVSTDKKSSAIPKRMKVAAFSMSFTVCNRCTSDSEVRGTDNFTHLVVSAYLYYLDALVYHGKRLTGGGCQDPCKSWPDSLPSFACPQRPLHLPSWLATFGRCVHITPRWTVHRFCSQQSM